MQILEGRISEKMANKEYTAVPPAANFKVQTIWDIVSIYKSLCTISPEYLNIVRQIFLIHMDQSWTANPDTIGVADNDWKRIYGFISQCKEASANTKPLETGCPHEEETPNSELEALDLNEMVEDEEYDVVIDQMWLILKTVIPACAKLNEFDDNKLPEVQALLRTYFTIPLTPRWTHPGVWQIFYPQMFRGFDISAEKAKMKECATATWELNGGVAGRMGRQSWMTETEAPSGGSGKARFVRKRPPTS